MLLLNMWLEVPSRARRALPAIRRSEKEGGRGPPEFSCVANVLFSVPVVSCIQQSTPASVLASVPKSISANFSASVQTIPKVTLLVASILNRVSTSI